MSTSRSVGTIGARRLLVAGLLAALMLVFAVQPALAHETRDVGDYTWVVGWLDEPAYAGLPNSVSLAISDTDTEDPFEDLGDSLEVDITFGEATMTMGMRSQFGQPGSYRADLVPSRPGTWEFRFHGTVDGVDVDETFTSGLETFNDIQDISAVSFPVQDPSTGELAERLERELGRIEEELGQVGTGHDTMTDDDADDTAAATDGSDGIARATSIVALVVGAAGLLLGLRRRPS